MLVYANKKGMGVCNTDLFYGVENMGVDTKINCLS